MPELPEVETIRAGLNALLPKKKIVTVWHNWPKSFPNTEKEVNGFLMNSRVDAVRRRAKVLIIDLSSAYSLVIHLKMTGQLVYRSNVENFGAGHPSDSLIGVLPDKSTHVIFSFSDDSKLFFNDQRKFGWVKLVPTNTIPEIDFFKKVGPEPLDEAFTWQVMQERLKRRPGSSIKAVLLDQTILAGVGNIYADESLWGAKIHPSTLVRDIPEQKVKKLHESLIAVLRLSIEKGGSTDKNYVNAEGKRGSYLSFAKVFHREGLACPRCGTVIEKLRVAGRGTHICPHCQKLKRQTSL